MESMIDLRSLMLQPFTEMTDAQVTSCGRWFLAAAASYYVALTLKKPIAADTKQAIEGHLPQGFDRSMIDARLQQRRNKELMMHALQISERRDELRRATSREAKLRGWNDIFRLTLVAIISGCYVHSLTLCLFAMKNTIRVLVFLIRQRDEAHASKHSTNGALGRVKVWWSGGTRSLVTDLMMEQMARGLQHRASPFAAIGVGEEIPLPVPPTAREPSSAFMTAPPPLASAVNLTSPIVASIPSALQQLHTTTNIDDSNNHDINMDTNTFTASRNEHFSSSVDPLSAGRAGRAGSAWDGEDVVPGRNSTEPGVTRVDSSERSHAEASSEAAGIASTSALPGATVHCRPATATVASSQLPQCAVRSPQQQMEEDRQQCYFDMRQFRAQLQALEAASAMAEQSFSVRVVLEAAVPAIVRCATRVVDYALNQRPAHAFAAAGIATAADLRALWMEMAEHMEHEACVAEWMREAVATAPPRLLPTSLERMSQGEDEYTGDGMSNNNNDNPYNRNIVAFSSRNARSSNMPDSSNNTRGNHDTSDNDADGTNDANGIRYIVSSNASKANTPNNKKEADADHMEQDGETMQNGEAAHSQTHARQRRARLHVARVATSSSSSLSSSDSEDVVHMPHRSALTFGADGRPVRMGGRIKSYGSKPDLNTLGDFGAQLDCQVEREEEEEDDFVYDDGSTSEERAARTEALRREQLAKEKSASFFQELIRSASFAELSLTYAAELLYGVINSASDLSTVKSYDAASDSAKMLMIIAGLDQYRQQTFDAEFEMKPYIRLFCEEMVRSTCS